MKSYQPDLLPLQLADLESLGELYQQAFLALTSDRIEEASELLNLANPLLCKLQDRDRQMRKSQQPPPRTLSDRTREVLALHNKLLAECRKEHKITGEACGKLATSRRFLQGYKTHKIHSGRFLDGEG